MLYEDYPIVDLDSDPEVGEDSSDDDIDVLLNGTVEQRRRLRRRSLGHKSESSEDEFEKEMREELDETMKYIRQGHQTRDVVMAGPSDAAGAKETEQKKKIKDKDAAEQFYDDAYFDSDSDDDETSPEKAKRKHPIPSNDDLLYDPNIDDDNQKWIDRQRRKYQPMATPGDSIQKPTAPAQNPKPLPHSDAVLNCPACMTVLCLDCQRHTTYKNQYRAMFVMNCRVDETEVLKYPLQTEPKKGKSKKQKQKKKAAEATSEGASNSEDVTALDPAKDDIYHPVRCTCCTTEVGVCDEDELYHFFNVLASYS